MKFAPAYRAAGEEWIGSMREAAKRITAFHEKQRQRTWIDFEDGSLWGSGYGRWSAWASTYREARRPIPPAC